MLGKSLPNWFLNPGAVQLRRHVRNKREPLCDTVDVIEANSSFARIRLSNGAESAESTQNLAPCPCDFRIFMNDDAASKITNQETRSPTAFDEIAHPMENHSNEAQKDMDFENETSTSKLWAPEESRGPEFKCSIRIRHKPNR